MKQQSKYVKKKLNAHQGEPKCVITGDNLQDDTVYCDMQTGEVKTGTIHFSDEFVAECAQRLAYFLLDNPNLLKRTEEGNG